MKLTQNIQSALKKALFSSVNIIAQGAPASPEIQEKINLDEYFEYWKSITRDNAKIPSRIFLLHDLILDRDPKKGSFSPITNSNKLANGCYTWQGLSIASNSLFSLLNYKKLDYMENKMIMLSGLTIDEIKNRIKSFM